MNGEGNLNGSAIWASLMVVALLNLCSTTAEAEEPVTDEPLTTDVEAADAATTVPAAEDVGDALAPLAEGVPAEPTDAQPAIESVKASVAKVEADAAAGIGDSYVIEFGDSFDWVRLTSGEWIKGNIDRLREDNLEFDSDILEMLEIDFGDVTHVHSPQINTYVFHKRVSATGKAVITPDKVIVQTAEEGTKVFERSELESILEGGRRERDWWYTKLRFGFTLNRGNTDQLTYDIKWNILREDQLTRLDLNYNATFGRTNGVQNVNRHLGEFDFRVFVSDRWFVVPAFGQLLNDRFANTKFRATPAVGAGVHIIDKPNVTWDFTTGFGYQYLRYRAAEQGTKNPQHDAFIPLYTKLDFDITSDIDFTISWLTNLVVTTIGNTNHTGTADLIIEVTDILDFDIAFLYLRTEEPAQPVDPNLPRIEKNDYQLVIGIALELG